MTAARALQEPSAPPVAALRLTDALPPQPHAEWRAPLSLEVPEGAFCVIETTPARSAALMRLAAGLLAPAAGRVEVLGAEPARLDRRAAQRLRRSLGVGLIPPGLVSNLTLHMNVVVPLVYSGLAEPEDARRRADEALQACLVARWAWHRPADVPPDARQRAVLARAAARGPRLLLLDDPLWSIGREDAAPLLRFCRARAATVIIATHRPDAALATHADLVARWGDGGMRIDALGSR